jgi:hypothetical protein
MGTSIAPKLWYKGENNPNDYSGGINAVWDGTPAYAAGKVGYAFKIDYDSHLTKDNDYQLHVTNNNLFNFVPSGNFSFRFWIKIEDGATLSNFWPIVKGSVSSSQAQDWGIMVYGAPNPEYYSILIGYNNHNQGFASQVIKDYDWHDILITYSNGYWNLYVDSVDYTPDNTQRLIANNSVDLHIAASWYGKAKCSLDELRIYDSVISIDNIDEITVPEGKMQFIAGGSTITINRPGYGYAVDCVLPIVTADKHPSGYSFFDRDASKTDHYRVLNTATWQLPTDQKLALNAFFRAASLGRCETVTLRLGATATGFFPFGPDYGDVGDFTVRLLSQVQSGILLSPWRYWQDGLSLVLVTAPAYALPSQVDQGSFQIGTVNGLLFPQEGFKPEARYNHRTDLSLSGVPSSIDGLESSDSWESSWDQQCNQSKAAALVSFLTGATGRSADISVIAGENYYTFGGDNGSGNAYTCKFLGSSHERKKIIISIRHDRYNQFTIPMTFWMTGIGANEYVFQDGENIFTDGEFVFN